MHTRRILSLLLVAGLIVSAGGTTAMAQTDSATGIERTATASSTAAEQGSDQSTSPENYTRLYIEDGYTHLRLKPGESDSVNVTVENGEETSVTLSPRVVIPPRGQPPVEKDWVSIDATDTTLASGETREFEITVSVPEDAEIRRYGGMVAFTDETIRYPGRPPRPVHGVSLNVEVWKEPTVTIQSERYIHSQVKAGDSFTKEITIENTGEQAVPLNPQVNTEQRRRHGYMTSSGDQETLDRSWISVDAPSEVRAGETETVSITVSPPANAKRGDYSTEVELGLKDPARPERDSYWQRIDLNFQVWTQPEEPFETTFAVSEDTTNATLTLRTNRHRPGSSSADADFDVTFVSPYNNEIDAERVQVTDSGRVTLGDERRPGISDGTYGTEGSEQTFTYRLDSPSDGTWSVRIMPENTMDFEYEITRDEASD